MQDGLIPNLDDINKTAFCIPYNPDGMPQSFSLIHYTDDSNTTLPVSAYEERDLEDGREMRFSAYKVAWKKCLDRVQDIIRELQKSSVNSVVNELKTSYTNSLPGLPYSELPVVSIINPSLGSSFLTSIMTLLESEEPIPPSDEQAKCLVIHLYPGDFPNIMTGMKSIITAFLEKADLERGKHRPATSLANYDIKLLVAWYKTWMNTLETEDVNLPRNLVVVLHDFEQFEPSVMQDVFYIFSGHVNELPVVFLLSMSSPSTNHLNDAYSRATMSLLRVRTFIAPSGSVILQEVLLKTFFSVDFEPDIMIGPAILEYLQDYFTRYNSSADVILTILQIVHLRHFSSDPLSVLVLETPSLDALSDANSSGFVNSIAIRLLLPIGNDSTDMAEQEPFTSAQIESMIRKVDAARQTYRSCFRNLRIAFSLMVRTQAFLEEQGYKGLDWSSDIKSGSNSSGTNLFKPMLNVLRANVQKDIKQLSLLTRQDLLQNFHDFYTNIPIDGSTLEDRMRIVALKTQLRPASDDDVEKISEITTSFSEWLAKFLKFRLTPLDDCELWDVWYTGQAPFSSEILNPSIRASMMAGLLRPHEYAIDVSVPFKGDSPERGIWELPDSSILFKRYLDSGKMINVYDWFESFKTVLDTQHEKLHELVMPKKRKGPKAKKQLAAKAKSEAKTEEEQEKWHLEVQARFVRAMHELDYLGFIKHTGRKADHVLRTHFDIDDAE
ncbi:hypothetical protein CVT25_014294 [Psilocybe cyanescens]|uniref:Uncharacterized protein n=1 Tax=Psilocybe cyanescens TaxID=93625 RepID=A0A409XL27_PSICY|nr:hypothetical protein CVT25_014294 [Psilocybe cyanescens]